jgi:hypothetical protein
MLKRDRSSEEKHADRLAKTGIMRLGGTNPAPVEPTPFPYTLYWDVLGRQGQRCVPLRQTKELIQIKFEDGYIAVVNRRAIRQVRP